jgi:two-component system sensor histidine kinase FlrB
MEPAAVPGPERREVPSDAMAPGNTPPQDEVQTLRQRLATLEAAEAMAQTAITAFQQTVADLQAAEAALRAQNADLQAMRMALEAERARYSALFLLAPDGYLVTDTAGVLQEVNQAGAALLGQPAAMLVGKPLRFFLVEADQPQFDTLLARLLRQERVPPWETQLQPQQGAPVPVSLSMAVEPAAGGEVRAVYWLVRDLTAFKHAEAERQRLEREAQRAQHFALLGRLAAGLSHEIRNPLAAVFLHIDMLEDILREQAPASFSLVADTLADTRTQMARIEDLVQDYLTLVRAPQSERTLQDLGAALQEWATPWEQMAAASGVLVQYEGLETVGMLVFHASTLRRALLNLVQNALEAMPDGGTLWLRGRREGATVQLDVCDTGSGIPPDHQARIFEPLYTTKPGGTGLGLYIVQEVVAAHGGHVAVQSAVGQGTTFTITLPLSGA